ncbi:hypothetical protein PG993_007584 [Apiospora rasikravindrae]|uniref:ER membrane protein complex subunit 7 beta-sandwich domain-containing protein n=1 Tax=Apiospora rasikravindrae TaxID=990691 RepID=A0ABR1SXX5_9PEZI
MRVSISAAAALLSLLQPLASALATTAVTLAVPAQPALPNPNVLPPSTHATLATLYTTYSAPLSAANTFVFRNVTPGSYLADVHCATHAFAPLRVDVVASSAPEKLGLLSVQAWETFRGNDWDNKGEEAKEIALGGTPGSSLATAKAALPVRCLAPKQYFIERSSFSVTSILKNPMILLAMVSMGIFFLMPKMVENMDPEMRAEFEEQQKNNPMASLMGGGGQQAANPMGNFDMAAFLAGSSNKKDEGGPAAGAASDAGNGAGKRRK